MLGSMIQRLKAPWMRAVRVENEQPVSVTVVIQEGLQSHPNPGSNSLLTDLPFPEQLVVHDEGRQIDYRPEFSAVDISPCTREDVCRDQFRLVENLTAESMKLDLGITGEPSTSNAQGASFTHKRDSNAEIATEQQCQLQHRGITIALQFPPPHQNSVGSSKGQEAFGRTVSTLSADSMAEHCRICQLTTDEPLIELGCHCRGELAKSHRSCIQQWFDNKGSNKCEVCRQVATNLPAPVSRPLHNFWTWRLSHSYGQGALQRWQGLGQFHPLLAALLILVAGLLFDVLISYYLGASALPVNIIIGVLVVLGLGTAARLIMECCHQRAITRSIRRMEMVADMEHLQSNNGHVQTSQ
ncbi:hypothetical protein KP509_22G075000 [Ceratopteris richardii]|uniref:RING-CH-type domain-containing protein n=1 Tax=Ceratopteris richardii TaxID=49495 RepID=A0A8T2S9U2_CERRI|nr:hypothetical protein KP509_22G075000 [Ceratopteris richardii]KAH7307745.1 hypothetical protein KP509_22G075000 [Ceratopteris richardii]